MSKCGKSPNTIKQCDKWKKITHPFYLMGSTYLFWDTTEKANLSRLIQELHTNAEA